MARALLAVVPLLSAVAAQAALANEWIAHTSDNFTLYSDADEEETVALLGDFEVFRLTALATLNLPDLPESERLTIVVFDTARDFGRIKGGLEASGFFYHSIFGPRMMIGPAGRSEVTQLILFHEYVHYLMNQRSTLNYPPWYREGLASVLQTTDITDSAILVGKAPAGYARALELGFDASLHDLIDPDFDGEIGGFYVTSWLITHYLLIDSFSNPARKQATTDYLRRYDAGEDAVEAFTQSFGVSPGEMQREIAAYGRRNALPGFSWPRIQYSGALSRRALEPGEDLYLLGDLAVEQDEYESAHYYFDRFEKLGIDSPLSTNVVSRRAIALVHEEKIEEGDELVAELLAQEIGDADVLADVAHYEFDRYVYDRDNNGGSGLTHLDRSIEYGERAVEKDPQDIEALYYLGLANELKGNLQAAADTLLKAYDISPSIPRLNVNLARVLIKGGQRDLGAYLVSRLYSATHSEEARAEFKAIRQQIEAGEVDSVLEKLDPP
jgi:tetratricopeptide (TPR) repeat protein